MLLIKKMTFIFLGWLLLAIFSMAVIHAAASYRAGVGQTVTVNEQGTCKKVTNSGSQDIFIPTNTSNEWSLFITNRPSYVLLNDCVINLVYNIHTDIQCSSSGGTVVDDGAGNKMCKYTAVSCPSGWTQYNNWSTTINASSSYNNGTCTTTNSATGRGVPIYRATCGLSPVTCSVTGHTWNNTGIESNSCSGGGATYYYNSRTGDTSCGSGGPYSCNGTNTTVSATRTETGCY